MRRRPKMTKVKQILNSKNQQTQKQLKLVEEIANELMQLNGVGHFKFKYSGARKRADSCSFDTIQL
jgi:hypothetical protein